MHRPILAVTCIALLVGCSQENTEEDSVGLGEGTDSPVSTPELGDSEKTQTEVQVAEPIAVETSVETATDNGSSSTPADSASDPPNSPQAPEPSTRPKVEDLGGGKYRIAEITFDSATREIRIPAVVNLKDELLEYAVVGDKGKTHEALLRVPARPFDLQVALLLLRYQPYRGTLFDGFDREATSPAEGEASVDSNIPEASRLSITIGLNPKDGEAQKEIPLEDWLLDIRTGKAVKRDFWLFTGFPDPTAMKYWKAEAESNTVGIFLDPFSPINYPHDGNRSDEVWKPNAPVMPDLDTEVEIIIRPFLDANQ